MAGEGNHVLGEIMHVDQLDSDSKPTETVQLKRGRGRGRPRRKTQVEEYVELGERGKGENAGKNEELLLNQGLHQLPDVSMELRKRPRTGKQVVESSEEKDVRQHKTQLLITLPEGISSPQVAVALGSRRITRSLKAYLDQDLVLNAKNTYPDIHDHLTAMGDISASKSSSDCTKEWGILAAETAFPSETRYLCQNMKTYFEQFPQRSSPLKSPVRNVVNTASNRQDHSIAMPNIPAAVFSSNHVKNQGLSFSPTSPMYKTAVPSETGNQNPAVFTKLGNQSMSEDHGLLDINECAANLGTEIHGSRDHCQTNDLEFIADNHQSIEEEACMPSNTNKEAACKRKNSGACPSRSVSLNLTQMCLLMDEDPADFDEVGSRSNEAFVSVNGYEVKAEMAPILRDIFISHGDIAKDCTFRAVRSRSCLLENVCGIYKRMEGANFMLVTPVELNSLLEEVRDLETTKIELGWLHQRLVQIMEAKEGIKTLKEEKRRTAEAIEIRKQELVGDKKQLEALVKKIHKDENVLTVQEAEEEKLHEKFNNMKSTLKVFYGKSLVYGLL